jgi:hypothetical protein
MGAAGAGAGEAWRCARGHVIQDIVYAAADGLQVTLYACTWDHISQGHPEVTLPDIERALISPIRICNHRVYPDQQIYEGPPGTTRLGRGIFPVVIVERRSDQAGTVVTARVSRRLYRGAQRWP